MFCLNNYCFVHKNENYIYVSLRLTDFLLSSDPYLRERVAIIYSTLANYDKGRKVITDNLNILLNLSKGLDDKLAIVRLKMARVLEILARNIDGLKKKKIINLFITVIKSKSIFDKKC